MTDAPRINPTPDAWLRGPLPDIDPFLLPAAHAFVQTAEDARRAVEGLTFDLLWARPGGAASVGFHLRHLAGATDRLLAYARGLPLDPAQREALAAEKTPDGPDAAGVLGLVETAMEAATGVLRGLPRDDLLAPRAVGKAALPTTVLGLVFHAAEHAQRHAGQAVTTARIVRSGMPR